MKKEEDDRDLTPYKKRKDDRLIRFDWAMKRLLRNKADYDIINGFLSSLLNMDVHIVSHLESEGNQEYEEDKFNRVDLLALNDKGEKFLIEVQNDSEDAYFHRMTYGVSKLITEYMHRGDNYDKIARVYSINIVYFDLGRGTDFVYTGKTEFRGLHDNDLLTLPERLKRKYDVSGVSEIFPQFYILKANNFNRWSQVPIEQWMYFLSTSKIPEDATAPGLQEAREKLRVASLSYAEREAYYQHLDNIVSAVSVMQTARDEGYYNGYESGVKEGIKQGKEEGFEIGDMKRLRDTVSKLRSKGYDDGAIANLLDEALDLIAGIK